MIHLPDSHTDAPLRLTPGGALIGIQGPKLGDAVQFTPNEYQSWLKATRNRYFKLRCRGVDMAATCTRCGAGKFPSPAHEYFTLMCTERPWKGNEIDALYGYASVTRDPFQRRTLLKGLQELEIGHPETARQLVAGDAQSVMVFAIGALVRIEQYEAEALASRINDLGSMGYDWTPFILE